ncbi:MAG: Fic family protein [Thiofilum sp.]|uniref:Fic family protein n=1 Tax=Thiofilum sp. TaxID=2212733 RepID=UPI0025E9627E|nr:Fic family protein [Thiofilum sp.]MBK8452894.1 Fic family protein [Thiofilum sp.]
MPWIHEHPDWPHFRWNADLLQPLLSQIRYQQGKLLGQMECLGFAIQQETSLRVLTHDVVKSSAIEGEILHPEAVRSSIARHLGLEQGGLNRRQRNVEGIVEVMLDATQHYAQPITTERLWGWHAALFPTGYSGIYPIMVGLWRLPSSDPMQVISHYKGREHIHFQAPSAQRLESEMAVFLSWLESSTSLDPILKAGIAHFWFITLHPFEDGNGRLARAISDLCLARADQLPQRFYSMSTQIELDKKAYYQQLETQQRSDLDITSWLIWFLKCLGRALDHAHSILQAVYYKDKIWKKANLETLNARQRLILNRMLEDFEGFMNTSKYATLAKCSTDTALRDIRELVASGLFIPNASGGRSTSYRLVAESELE